MTHSNAHRTPVHRAASAAGAAAAMIMVLGGCGTGSSDPSPDSGAPSGASASTSADIAPDTKDAEHPDVLAAALKSDDGQWSLDVTLSSQYDSPDRYADGWRVLDEDGTALGEHTLGHDHADEQPVTRTQTGLEIPDDVDVVTIEGRDTENGFGGATLDITVPR
ncbi:hypothetical protein [Janibacter sp. GS2]|uniref:hypothetical protein n=1 Tax=Janibacter sp. GS2 TaxID=3442646 RepID=UPI003EBF2D68